MAAFWSERRPSSARRSRLGLLAVAGPVLLAILVLGSLSVGHYALDPMDLIRAAWAQVLPAPASWHLSPTAAGVLTEVRLPRIAAALLVGAGLSASGSAYQSMFRNPLVSPDILGASAGAGLGASLMILLGEPYVVVQIAAFVGGLAAVVLTLAIARFVGRGSVVVLVLAGLVVAALSQAFISLTQFFADPETTLPAITFWLFGGLGSVTMSGLLVPAILVAACIAALFAIRWPITVLATGEDEARTLGINRRLVWGVALVASTVMTATVVSIAGIVGWVGLVVPHLARFIVGPRFNRLLLASTLIGAGFLLTVDDLGRSVTAVQLPLGVLTAIIGAPFFVLVLAKARDQWF